MNSAEAGLNGLFHSSVNAADRLLLSRLGDFLAGENIESYIVGGWVRDVLLERGTADIDFAIASDALKVAPRIADALGGKYVPLDKVNKVGRVVLADRGPTSSGLPFGLDFSTIPGNIEEDLARRDFTVDAMAVNLSQFRQGTAGIQVIDLFDGRNDLRCGILRVVSETVFVSDAARLLRGVRLAAELGFDIDSETEALIRQHSQLITSVAGERIREELVRLLAVPRQVFSYLDELGLLAALFPELDQTRGVEQPKEHFWDVFEHSLRTVGAVDFLLRQGTWEHGGEEILEVVPWSEELAEHFSSEVSSGSTRRILLKLAALLHDISKPQTKVFEADGRMRFLGHALEGEVLTANILERLRFSGKEKKLVETEVRHHLRPGQLSPEGMPTRRAIYRYFRDTAEAGTDILFLSLADHLAARGPGLIPANWQEHASLVDYVIGKQGEKENIVRPAKLVDGYDIINIFGTRPGPEVGEMLETVREAQASGEVTTREQALSFIEGLKRKNA